MENPWPPIDTVKVVISSSFEADTVYIRYRDYIETEAGESRNNVIFISMGNRAVHSLNLYTVNMPAVMEVTEGIRWHGPGPVAPVLVIETSPDIEPRQYIFEIGVEIDGKDYGTIPCTIKVIPETTPTPVPQPIPQQPTKPFLEIISVTSPVRPLANATLVAQGDAGAECSITIDYGPSGVQCLHPKIADGSGKVSWTWTVGNFRGTWEIVVKASYSGETAYRSTFFTIQ